VSVKRMNSEFKYYSQFGEDFLLWEFFHRKREGFYVDIGAFDGIHLSNSYSFEQKGWHGICIEPNPEIFAYCRENRPGAFCVNMACIGSPRQKEVKFYREEIGLLSTTINSAAKQADIRQRYHNRGLPFSGLKELNVKAATLNDLLTTHFPGLKQIDFISIDTEGNEADILEGIDTARFDIRVFVIEAHTRRDETDITALLQRKGGYCLARKLEENLVFVKTEEDVQEMRQIEIHCTIEKQIHPLGEKYSLPRLLEGKKIRTAAPGKPVKKEEVKR
jgi:FkbM family methyltransferase